MKPFRFLPILPAALLGAAPALAERGADGDLRIIYWQAASVLNPYISTSGKDVDPASLTLEPLAGYDPEGRLFPRLAADIPTVENGGIAADYTSITWKLKEGLTWSDGSPVTAEDVKFTAEYCMAPEFGCAVAARFSGISSVEALDPLTVKITFEQPKYVPYQAFVGSRVPVLQKAQFQNCLGAAGASCSEQNFKPLGTGPYVVTEFRPNDVAQFEINPNYRDPDRPGFAHVTVKGGGDAAASGRAVLETGEFDFAWNLMLDPETLAQMEAAGKGKTFVSFGTMVERIELNQTDPDPALGGERATLAHPHPFLTDPAVRQALSMAIDRNLLAEIGYGKSGQASCDIVPLPTDYSPANHDCLTQDIDGAKALLDQAGWVPGADGVREKDGQRLEILFQTSVNAVRQDVQALVKQWWQEIGVETELKTVDGSVFFGGDAGSPDTIQKLYADAQMYTNSFDNPDPEAFMGNLTCGRIPSPENQWQGNNFARFCDAAYDEKVTLLQQTADPAERQAMVKELALMPTADTNILIPLVHRGMVSAHVNSLAGIIPNAWESDLWNLQDWTRTE